jgi:4-amino-4-deoxy-L-arabinose transferase-like glycosyltransferase
MSRVSLDGRRAAWLAAFALAFALAPLVHVRPRADGRESFIGHGDQAAMADVARNLAEGRGPVTDAVWLLRDGGIPGNQVTGPDPYWSPYLPALVAPFFRVLGATREVVVLVASLHLLAIAGLAAHWARRLCGSRLAALAVALFLLYQPVMTERLGGLFDLYLSCYVALSGTLLIQAIERDSSRLFLLAGLAAGVALGIKVSGALVAGCAAAFFLIPPHWARLRRALPYGLGAALGVGPLLAFNLWSFGSPVPPGLRLVREGLVTTYVVRDHYRAYYDPEPVAHSPQQIQRARATMLKSRPKRFARELLKGAVVPWSVLLPAGWYALGERLRRRRAPPPSRAERLFRRGSGLLLAGGALLAFAVELEARYWNFLVPPLAVLGAVGVARTARPLLWLALLHSLWLGWGRWESFRYWKTPPAYEVVRQLVPADAVVLTQFPLQHAFHTRRRSVALPYTSKRQVLREVAERYGAEYLVIVRADARHRFYDPIEQGQFPPWLERVHYAPDLVVGRLRFAGARSRP